MINIKQIGVHEQCFKQCFMLFYVKNNKLNGL